MPPRIRTRATRALKENIGANGKTKLKSSENCRKVLGDKTNSTSDENASLGVPPKISKTVSQASKTDHENKARPRRDRRLPSRYVENELLANLSGNKDETNDNNLPKGKKTTKNISPIEKKNGSNNKKNIEDISPVKKAKTDSDTTNPSPYKTPSKQETSIIVNRPKRIHRLPSRFEDHSISPHKYIPIQPVNASTPISLSKTNIEKTKDANAGTPIPLSKTKVDKAREPTPHTKRTRAAKQAALKKKVIDISIDNSSPDTNNNPKSKSSRSKKTVTQPPAILAQNKKSKKVTSPKKIFTSPRKVIASPLKTFTFSKNTTISAKKTVFFSKKTTSSPLNKAGITKKATGKTSFRVLEDRKSIDANNHDIYEFTYDPKKEPKPQKKKRRNITKKRPPKPKTLVIKNNYDQNINKALNALKNVVNKNLPSTSGETVKSIKAQKIITKPQQQPHVQQSIPTVTNFVTNITNYANNTNPANDTGKSSVYEANYASIRIEDIAADIEPSIEHPNEMNYSPVNSPRPKTPVLNTRKSCIKPVQSNDPLNLREDFSFDDQPVASSSMNMSVKHPLASPWRVEFGSLPIKWPVNTYVKANMTPAVESSFIGSSDSIKKHVYTNMVVESQGALPEVVHTTPNLKQTSIISFIKEAAERSASKKRKGRLSVTPTKANSLFEDLSNMNNVIKTPRKVGRKDTHNKAADKDSEEKRNNSDKVLNSSNEDLELQNENSDESRKENRKRKNEGTISDKPAKSPYKKKYKDNTYYGFDDSENLDQENVSPSKINDPKIRALRPRSRAVLQEINAQTGPTRATIPAKSKIALSSDAVNKVYEELKSAADAPVFPEKGVVTENPTNINNMSVDDEDSASVHLFEDIEFIHQLKPIRKSYSKPNKKVTFRQRSVSDSESPTSDVPDNADSSYEDDLADLTFEVPNVKEKKARKKKKPKGKRTKKEEQEADAWAAGFNSMCEDIEAFPLVVE